MAKMGFWYQAHELFFSLIFNNSFPLFMENIFHTLLNVKQVRQAEVSELVKHTSKFNKLATRWVWVTDSSGVN